VRPTAGIILSDYALRVGETATLTVTFSEAVSGFTNADLTIANGTLTAVSSSDGGITWTATFTPTASVEDATNVITLDNTGVSDAAGNTGSGTTDSPNYAIDTVRPIITNITSSTADGTYVPSNVITITVTFSEAVTITGTPTLTLNSGGTVSYSSGSGTTALTFSYTVGIGESSWDLEYSTTNSLALAGATIKDVSGNDATLTLPALWGTSSLGGQKNILIAINPSSGGIITAGQDGCNPFNPNAITNKEVPSDYVGTLEYKWQSSTTSSMTGFVDIANSNAATYDPGLLTANTWYKRLARVDCMEDWTGAAESNVVKMTVFDLPSEPTAGSNSHTYDGTEKTAVAIVGIGETVDWYANITGDTPAAVPTGTTVGTYSAYAEARNTTKGCISTSRNLITLEITKAMLTVTADTKTKKYGEDNPALTFVYSGWKNGDSEAVLTSRPTASTTVTATSPAAVYSNAITLTGGVAENYDFNYLPANLEVTKIMLTATANAQTKIFGEANPTLTFQYSGWKNSDTEADLDYIPTTTTTVNLLTNVGTHSNAITVSGGVDNNYSFSYVPANFTVTKAMLTVTADAKSKVYGEANPTMTFQYSGWKNSDNETVLNTKPSASTTLGMLTNAGIYTNVIKVSGGVDNNYDFKYVSANLTVTKAILTVTAGAKTKVYGEANPVLTFQYRGWTNNENEAVLDIKPLASTSVDLQTSVGAHSKVITMSGGRDNNYDFTYVPADFVITKAPLTIEAEAQNKVYDGTTTANVPIAKLVGIRNVDPVKLTIGTASFEHKNVGNGISVTVFGSNISGVGAGNYTLTEVSGLKANIAQKQLTISDYSIVTNKMFDNTTTVTVENVGTLQGLASSDANLVTVSAIATYNNATVGEDKVITVVYKISGSAVSNYIQPVDLIITDAKISEIVKLSENLEVPVTGECQGEDLSIGYQVLKGTPSEYRITFSAAALAAGFVNTGYLPLASSQSLDRLNIQVPANMAEGVYSANLQFRNELNVESPAYPFQFAIKLAKSYVVKKFDDLIVCDNSSNRFTSFQWYKNGQPIPGATGQFYREQAGLDGFYSLQVSTIEGAVLWSCDQEIHTRTLKNATISAYPIPARSFVPFTVKVTDLNDQDLKGAVLRIYNVMGVLVQTITDVKQENSVSLPFGDYIGTVVTSDQRKLTCKILVKN
jgi:hypothetical protein